jgi:hypothetical protein
MKALRYDKLHLGGIDVALPALVSIDARQQRSARRMLIVAGIASGYVDTIVGPLVAQWLALYARGRFVENGRGADGDLAAEAFHDKLTCSFSGDVPFVAALVLPRRAPPRAAASASCLRQTPAVKALHNNRRDTVDNALSRFMNGSKFARWKFCGAVRCYLNPRCGSAQVTFGDMPGGIELIRTPERGASMADAVPQSLELCAWYGFGVATRDPAAAIMTLRNDVGEFRHPLIRSRAAGHV